MDGHNKHHQRWHNKHHQGITENLKDGHNKHHQRDGHNKHHQRKLKRWA